MKNKESGDTLINNEIKNLKEEANCGRITRRRFMSSLLQLGIALPTAGTMAQSLTQGREVAPLCGQYDYIVIGAGSAGCVLADRLSATGATVLIIEAGTGNLNQPTITDGQRWTENIGSSLDWGYPVTGQPYFNNRPSTAAAGKVIGGGGSINGMLWFRGDERDLRKWHRIVGPGWNPRRMLHAYRRVENYLPADNPYRSTTGTISVGRYAYDNPITAASISGAYELGIPETDHNASRYIDGAGPADVNITPDGRRSGPAQTYLARAIARDNVSIITNALVNHLDIKQNRCEGVSVVIDGQTRYFDASHEVLLCAGTFGSPRILMQSGVGPEKPLREAGVPLKHLHSNVGRNLHDHTIMQNIIFDAGSALSPNETFGRVATQAFFRTNSRSEAPDIQIMCMQGIFPPGTGIPGSGFSIMPWLAKPESRGSLSITNANPAGTLRIDPNYLNEKKDRDTLVASLEYSLAWGQTNALSRFSAGPRFPGKVPSTYSEKLAFVKQNTTPGFHCVGTCSAGRNPEQSVVNEHFQVWGIDRLRVVDGSVIPEIPGVNPHALILTLSELASESLGLI